MWNLVGFSMGGLTNIIFAMRKLEKFKSLISIDGSIRTYFEKAIKSPGINFQKFQTPLLLFASNGDDWSGHVIY